MSSGRKSAFCALVLRRVTNSQQAGSLAHGAALPGLPALETATIGTSAPGLPLDSSASPRVEHMAVYLLRASGGIRCQSGHTQHDYAASWRVARERAARMSMSVLIARGAVQSDDVMWVEG